MSDLIANQLCHAFSTPRQPLVVLDDVSFSLSVGESLSIVGPSGTGKSTLLHILGTLEKPTSGSLTLAGQDPLKLSATRLAAFRNRHIGFVFQDHHLLPQLTAMENVLLPGLATGGTSDELASRAAALLESVGLTDRQAHRPSELSGGERQRVAIARALLMQPTLLLADEPTGNLDPRTAREIGDLLLSLVQSKDTHSMLVLVTHDVELAARLQQTATLTDGRLTMERAPSNP